MIDVALWPADDTEGGVGDVFTADAAANAAELRSAALAALPDALPGQEPWLASDARFKVIRAGRRTGKSRFAMIAAIAGHGPDVWDATGVRRKMFRGIADGLDVVWVAQDYPNLSTVMWREEFKPRFEPIAGVTTNANEHFVHFDGLGTLFLRPATAIAGIRGIGKRLGGVIIDEAAWLDLESALQDVIMAALLDNEGWLILMSTTNAGPDGNADKRVPSYFNLICEKIKAGERGEEWVEFYGTAHDNPRLSKKAIQDLIAEFPKGSPQLEQEVYAKLLRGGVGFALAELDEGTHLVEPFRVPRHWAEFGAFDWGFAHPFCFGWFAVNEDGTVYLVESVHGVGLQPPQIAERIHLTVPVRRLRYIDAGHDCWHVIKARGENTPTLEEQFRKAGIPMRKANIDRVPGLNNMRHFLGWRPSDGDPGKPPRFFIMDTPNNRITYKVLAAMQIDPKNLEDALGVDGTTIGTGDDPFDMSRYGLASRVRKAKPEEDAEPFSAFSPEALQAEIDQRQKVENRSGILRPQRRRRGFTDPMFGAL